MTRAERRHHTQRIKDRFYRKNRVHKYWPHNEFNAGLYANHGKTCSCWMCGNPRRVSKKKTIQELKADEAESLDVSMV